MAAEPGSCSASPSEDFVSPLFPVLNPYPVQVTGVISVMDNWTSTNIRADQNKVLPMRTLPTRDSKTSVSLQTTTPNNPFLFLEALIKAYQV